MLTTYLHMTNIAIRAHRTLPDALVTAKEVSVGPRRFEAPIRSRPADLFEEGEKLLDTSYGSGECRFEVSTQTLNDLADGRIEDISEAIATKRATVRDDEVAVAVVTYSGRGIVNVAGLNELIGLLAGKFDVIAGPLMSEQLDSVELDDNPEPFNRFVENTERFLGAVERTGADGAVLGIVPVLSQERMDELVDMHLQADVDGFCLDFLDKKPTARDRVRGCVVPFMERLGRERRYRSSLIYAVNAYRGQNRTGTPRSPAEDFFAFGLGIDVLGGRHYFPRKGWSDNDEVEFRWFDSDTYEQEYLSIAGLRDTLPDRSGFDPADVLDMARDDDHRGRLQVLLGVERMNAAYADLRAAIDDGRTAEFITNKSGTNNRIDAQMQAVHEAYDDGHSSPALTSF